MDTQDKIVKLYTGGDVIINHIKQELEEKGINCLVKDSYKQSISVGFVDGVPSAIDVFVLEKDLEEAMKIVNDLKPE
ncbi:MAG: DUF2007 domain-containing protein [Draconibacterium sp.]